MLNPSDLADEMQAAIGHSDKPTTSEILGLATAIVNNLLTATVTFAPGSITGTAPPQPGPVVDAQGTGGIILALPATLQAELISVFGQSTPQLIGLANALASTFSAGTGELPIGTITAISTAVGPPTPAPGVFTGAGTGGMVDNLDPSLLDSGIASALGGTSSEITNISQAITDHISMNGSVEVPVITGTIPAAGGPVVGGTGVGSIL